MKETEILKQCLDWLFLKNIFSFRVNNTGIYDPSRKAFRSFQGMRGVSDILGIYNGKFLAIEVKVPGKEPTKTQKEFLQSVVDNGGISMCVHSLEELEKDLKEIDNIQNK